VGLPGVWATDKYLIAVSPPDEKLVKRHARYQVATPYTWIHLERTFLDVTCHALVTGMVAMRCRGK